MANITFLDENIEVVDEEIAHFDAALKSVRESKLELNEAENSIIFTESVIKRIRANLLEFRNKIWPQIESFIENPDRFLIYKKDPKLIDYWIRCFVEIEYDINILYHLLGNLPKKLVGTWQKGRKTSELIQKLIGETRYLSEQSDEFRKKIFGKKRRFTFFNVPPDFFNQDTVEAKEQKVRELRTAFMNTYHLL